MEPIYGACPLFAIFHAGLARPRSHRYPPAARGRPRQPKVDHRHWPGIDHWL